MNRASSKFVLPVLLALIVTISLPVCARQQEVKQVGSHNRVASPVALACDSQQLTSYNGDVSHYQRNSGATIITIQTDWDTVESVKIKHPGPDGVIPYLMLNGKLFSADDWAKIEVEPGVLLDGMRAIVWVCLDEETQAVIDWRPPT